MFKVGFWIENTKKKQPNTFTGWRQMAKVDKGLRPARGKGRKLIQVFQG